MRWEGRAGEDRMSERWRAADRDGEHNKGKNHETRMLSWSMAEQAGGEEGRRRETQRIAHGHQSELNSDWAWKRPRS